MDQAWTRKMRRQLYKDEITVKVSNVIRNRIIQEKERNYVLLPLSRCGKKHESLIPPAFLKFALCHFAFTKDLRWYLILLTTRNLRKMSTPPTPKKWKAKVAFGIVQL